MEKSSVRAPRKRRNANFDMEECWKVPKKSTPKRVPCVPCPVQANTKSAPKSTQPKYTSEQRLKLKQEKIAKIISILENRSLYLKMKYISLNAANEYNKMVKEADEQVKIFLKTMDRGDSC